MGVLFHCGLTSHPPLTAWQIRFIWTGAGSKEKISWFLTRRNIASKEQNVKTAFVSRLEDKNAVGLGIIDFKHYHLKLLQYQMKINIE